MDSVSPSNCNLGLGRRVNSKADLVAFEKELVDQATYNDKVINQNISKYNPKCFFLK